MPFQRPVERQRKLEQNRPVICDAWFVGRNSRSLPLSSGGASGFKVNKLFCSRFPSGLAGSSIWKGDRQMRRKRNHIVEVRMTSSLRTALCGA